MAEELDPSIVADLLGLIAHDLRNPLSALQSNVSFVSTMVGSEDEDACEAISDALVSCDGLQRIIDNIELLAMRIRGARELDQFPVALGALLDEVAARSQATARSHGVELNVAPRERSGGDQVPAHREMLARALSNLIHNSIQHAPPGSVVRLSVRSDGDRIVAVVEDDGPALAEELSKLAFTAPGQLASKGLVHGRYSRGIGLFSAAVAATAAGAFVRTVAGPNGQGNMFELTISRKLTAA